jgi:hypothetical protein
MTTTETVNKLMNVEPGKWFSVTLRDGESLVEVIKELIDQRQPFELSDCYTRFKRIDDVFKTVV